jgi:hypothetical protein
MIIGSRARLTYIQDCVVISWLWACLTLSERHAQCIKSSWLRSRLLDVRIRRRMRSDQRHNVLFDSVLLVHSCGHVSHYPNGMMPNA